MFKASVVTVFLTCLLASASASVAQAQDASNIPNLKGTWAGTSHMHHKVHGHLKPEGKSAELVVLSQEGRVFHGRVGWSNKAPGKDTFSGVIDKDGVKHLGNLVGSQLPADIYARFLRGNLHYDEQLVGFEWATRPTARYGPNDTMLVKEYDTSVAGKANTGHTFGADLCPDTAGLDPVANRQAIEQRLLGSRVGALLAYLKTL